jgi:hypothetical protein
MNVIMRTGNAICAPILMSLQKTPEQGAYNSVYVATAPGIGEQRACGVDVSAMGACYLVPCVLASLRDLVNSISVLPRCTLHLDL